MGWMMLALIVDIVNVIWIYYNPPLGYALAERCTFDQTGDWELQI